MTNPDPGGPKIHGSTTLVLNLPVFTLVNVQCPESGKREEKIEDINLLFIHMHHLINEFRPHQVLRNRAPVHVFVYVTFCLV
jgi:hypothetical protein